MAFIYEAKHLPEKWQQLRTGNLDDAVNVAYLFIPNIPYEEIEEMWNTYQNQLSVVKYQMEDDLSKTILRAQIQILQSLPHVQAYMGSLDRLVQKSYVPLDFILELINQLKKELK